MAARGTGTTMSYPVLPWIEVSIADVHAWATEDPRFIERTAKAASIAGFTPRPDRYPREIATTAVPLIEVCPQPSYRHHRIGRPPVGPDPCPRRRVLTRGCPVDVLRAVAARPVRRPVRVAVEAPEHQGDHPPDHRRV